MPAIGGVAATLIALIVCFTVWNIHQDNSSTEREKACVASGQSWVSHTVHGDQVYECKPRRQ